MSAPPTPSHVATGDGRRPLRFGVVRRAGQACPEWQARCLRQLLAVDGVEAALLVVDREVSAPGAGRGQAVLWRLYADLYLKQRSRALRGVDVAPLFAGVPELYLARAGEFRDEELAALRGYDLDFILSLDPAVPEGEVLRVPRYGVWSFEFDAGEGDPGSPACFWPLYRGATVVGAALRRLDNGPTGGAILRAGSFPAIPYAYAATHDRVLLDAAGWPAQICRALGAGTPLPADAPPTPAAAPRGAPTDRQLAVFFLRLGWRFLATIFDRLRRADEWNIGVADAPIRAFLAPGARPPVHWLPAPVRGRAVADPFGLDGYPGPAILAEGFDYDTGQGHIAALALDSGAPATFEPVIVDSVHLSYPYLLRYRGDIYCIPETAAAREVRLYRAVSFPREWARCATLIEGFAAIDATVFEYEGRWWLLCSEQDGTPGMRLYAWHAADLLGPWTPHAANPIKTDIRSSRPAGTPFVHDGQLYRPAQDSSRGYGGAVALNRVLRLTPVEFAEDTVATVVPYADGPYPDGLHTLSAWGARTLIDGKRRRFIPREARRILRSALRKPRGAVAGSLRRAFRRPPVAGQPYLPSVPPASGPGDGGGHA